MSALAQVGHVPGSTGLRGAPTATAPRVLHVVGRMDRGGVETWLMQLLRNAPRDRARVDFLATREGRGDYDAEIAELGSAVRTCGSPGDPVRFTRRLWALLRGPEPYDVVHSHLHHFSGFVLAVARAARVPVRIAHSHSDTRHVEASAGAARRAYLRLMEASVRRCATHGIAVSSDAAAALFGPSWRDDGRWRLLRCGLDFQPFRAPVDVAAVREELGVPAHALLVGHVGRFDPCKNQQFLVQVTRALARRGEPVFLVLVGEGPLRAGVAEEAARCGVADRVRFAGLRSDVPRVLRAFDVFVLPSTREGLPLVGLEAQAAGRPIVMTDRATRELEVVPELFTWRSPDDSPESWADAIAAAARRPPPAIDPVAALERSEFALARTVPELLELYAGGSRAGGGR